MAKDVLTIRQLEDQLRRREETLAQLKKTDARQAAVDEAERRMQLTKRRLERARAADYDEEIEDIQQLRPTQE